MTDIIIRVVESYGYLPIVKLDGKEIYRGEYQNSPQSALEKCLENMAKHNESIYSL